MRPYAHLIELQRRLASTVSLEGRPRPRRFCAMDVAVRGNRGRAAAVVMDGEFHLLDRAVVEGPIKMPYVPGLLSFRETPILIRAFRKLSVRPDILLVDGQGFAHPRRFGLACHLGVLLDLPAIGCAKSLLIGEFGNLDNKRGSRIPLTDHGAQVGWVLRTRAGVKPIFVSPGHRVSMSAVCDIVMSVTGEFRIPEPLRLADRLSKFDLPAPSK